MRRAGRGFPPGADRLSAVAGHLERVPLRQSDQPDRRRLRRPRQFRHRARGRAFLAFALAHRRLDRGLGRRRIRRSASPRRSRSPSRSGRAASFARIILIPWVIPIVVAGLNWTWMLTPDYGVLNIWMVKLGLLSKPFYWLGNLDTALLTVSFVNIWRSFPFYTISLLAALHVGAEGSARVGGDRRRRAAPALRLHHHALSQDRLADPHLHPRHLDRDQFRFHLGHDPGRSATTRRRRCRS